ncbi:MAG: hypothetical protein HZC41_06325 [Chloroflexi bacterium]|nr:hypothetical protein [Chloroflexota bacterium]
MVATVQDYSREELLRCIQVNWGEYLPVLRALPADQQTVYACEQGFVSLRDFLIHVAAWWSKAIECAALYQYGGVFPLHDETDDEFDRRVIARYPGWTLADAEKYFTITWLTICGLVSHLPDKCFDNPVVNRWLAETIVLHYDQHESPAVFRRRRAVS